jgi:ParB family chromosome partitioning protein
MRVPWIKSSVEQLDLVALEGEAPVEDVSQTGGKEVANVCTLASSTGLSPDALAIDGLPLQVSIGSLSEDPLNPRTEFPEEEIAELAQDIAVRGILQPIVVLPLGDSRYRVLFGAKRLRAARRAGLETVPVVIGSQAHDVYAQVAENQKRHGLTPLDLARFMRSRVDAGESNAEIARQMGMDQTTVAHHLALLTLPPELEEALRTGRCTSPRTLYELAKLYEIKPARVTEILKGEGEITRRSVASAKKAQRTPRVARHTAVKSPREKSLVDRASDLCTRLESLLGQMNQPGTPVSPDELATLRRRLTELARR